MKSKGIRVKSEGKTAKNPQKLHFPAKIAKE